MAKKKKYSDEELIDLLDRRIKNAVGYLDSELKDERLTVIDYMQGDEPKQTRKGGSQFVSQDVYDSVGAMAAQVIETFSSSQQLVRFAPQGKEDEVRARAMTSVAAYVLFRQNPGYTIISDVVNDGLTSRLGVAKAWWEKAEEICEYSFEGLTENEVAVQALQGSYELDQDSIEEDGESQDGQPLYKGRMSVLEDKSQVQIAVIPPNEFLVSKRARSLEEASFVAHRVAKSKAELKAMAKEEGIPESEVDALKDGEYNHSVWDEEESERFDGVDDGVFAPEDEPDKVYVYEAYLKGDFDGKGSTGLWKITKCGHIIFSKERIKRLPFCVFTPIRIPHAFWGFNYAMKVVPVQRGKTSLFRAILDHTAVTINPRLQVVRGTLQNPNELTDPRRGGIINVNRPDGLIPLVQQPLNPFVFNTLQLLDSENEDTTGISRLSQGLNKDAVSQQNSAALVEQLTTNSQTRQKIVAKNFAFGFLIPLYYLIADLLAENASQEMMVEVAGEWQAVDPETWKTRRDLIAEMHLGYGEVDQEVQKWLMLHQLLSQDPSMGPFYGPMQRYNLYKKVFDLKGVKDTDAYLTPPEQAKPPQPDPMMIAELQLKQTEAEVKKAEIQLKQQEAQLKLVELQQKLSLQNKQIMLKAQNDQAHLQLDWAKHEHDVEIDNREMDIVERKATTDALTAIASPNS